MDKDKYLNVEIMNYPGVGKYNIPEIEGMKDFEIPEFKQFNYVLSGKVKTSEGVQFFLDDYQFERVWNIPDKYVSILQNYRCVLSPDFSLYSDFPIAVQLFNHYRKHWLAKYWQENGITVIPTIAWSTPESYEWCFDGEPTNSVVAVSTVGCMRNGKTREAFLDGYKEMIKRLNPSKILVFSHVKDISMLEGNTVFIPYNYNIGGIRNDNKEGVNK